MSPDTVNIQEAKTWVCLVCNKQYQYLGALKKHAKKNHPDEWKAARKAEREARKAEKEAKKAETEAAPAPTEELEAPEEPRAIAIEGPGEESAVFTPRVEGKTIEDYEAEIRNLKREIEELRRQLGEYGGDITDFDVAEEEASLPVFTFPGIPTKTQEQFPFAEAWIASPNKDRQLLKEAVAKARPPARLEDVISFAFYDADVVFVLMDGRKIKVRTTQK